MYSKLKFLDNSVDALKSGKMAVIDLGSNSLRLAIFNDVEKYPHQYISERYGAKLAENKNNDGDFNLSDEKIEEVIKVLKWFNWVCKAQEVETAIVIATSAIREAKNKDILLNRALMELGIEINVISGETEAKLSAIGAMNSIKNSNGLVLDLGGGSLEIYDTESKNQLSLPLGILSLKALTDDNPSKAKDLLKAELSKHSWLLKAVGKDIIANGGGMRSIAMLHMKKTGYPIQVAQGYSINRESSVDFISELFDVERIQNYFTGYDEKFKTAIPYRAALIKALFEINDNFENLKFSNFGLREGVLLSQLDNLEYNLSERYAKDLAKEKGFGLEYALSSYSFMSEVLNFVNHDLLYLTALLKDISRRTHKQYRAAYLFNKILHLDFVGINHKLRVQLALACYYAHESTLTDKQCKIVDKILTKQEILECKLVGQAYKLTELINPAKNGDFSESSISLKNGIITFKTSDEIKDIISIGLEKRLDKLNDIYQKIKKENS